MGSTCRRNWGVALHAVIINRYKKYSKVSVGIKVYLANI